MSDISNRERCEFGNILDLDGLPHAKLCYGCMKKDLLVGDDAHGNGRALLQEMEEMVLARSENRRSAIAAVEQYTNVDAALTYAELYSQLGGQITIKFLFNTPEQLSECHAALCEHFGADNVRCLGRPTEFPAEAAFDIDDEEDEEE